MEPRDGRHRFFVVTSGRTGSSLLAAVLADAGAEFGIPTPEQWYAGGGALEHPELHRVSAWMGYAYEISADRPGIGLRRYLWDIYRSVGKSHLRKLLREASYIKGQGADFAVQLAFKMGYFPTIIVSYRSFEDFAISSAMKSGRSNLETLVNYYNRVNRNALLLLRMFGGCVVRYSDLTDPDNTAWANVIEQVTGLSAKRLLASRDRRVSTSKFVSLESTIIDESVQDTYSAIDGLAGRAFPPSPQALRSWESMCAHRSAGVRRDWSETLKIEIEAIWRSVCDHRFPWYARIIAPLCALAYTLAPIDPIPDSTPVIGHLDDLTVAGLCVALFIRLMPSSLRHQHRSTAAERRRILTSARSSPR